MQDPEYVEKRLLEYFLGTTRALFLDNPTVRKNRKIMAPATALEVYFRRSFSTAVISSDGKIIVFLKGSVLYHARGTIHAPLAVASALRDVTLTS